MAVLSMSRMEIDRIHVLRDVLAERITVREAAQLMRVTPRQIFRLLRAYHADRPAALISKKRGKPSNRSYPAGVRTEAVALVKCSDGRRKPGARRAERGLTACPEGCSELALGLSRDDRALPESARVSTLRQSEIVRWGPEMIPIEARWGFERRL
jgi:Winged helix-turn helix